MKGNSSLVLALLIALGTSAFADTSVKIEEEADKAAGMNHMPQARALYVKAGEQRLKEAALYEKKGDELSFETTDESRARISAKTSSAFHFGSNSGSPLRRLTDQLPSPQLEPQRVSSSPFLATNEI